ncbi:hypothetical protein GGR53DRAFT_294540 [Hypoxylon sp. FL1150]|nr:hypothetical protein GGR53DRAFT_294540 [Hypoxylon sp. FL1150]
MYRGGFLSLVGSSIYLFLLAAVSRPHADIRRHSRKQLERRIRRKGAVEHLDFFEQATPENREPSTDPKEMRYLEQVAAQLLVAGYEPPYIWLYSTIYSLTNGARCASHSCR